MPALQVPWLRFGPQPGLKGNPVPGIGGVKARCLPEVRNYPRSCKLHGVFSHAMPLLSFGS